MAFDLGSTDKSTTNQAHHRVAGGSDDFLVEMVDEDRQEGFLSRKMKSFSPRSSETQLLVPLYKYGHFGWRFGVLMGLL